MGNHLDLHHSSFQHLYPMSLRKTAFNLYCILNFASGLEGLSCTCY